MMLKQGLDHVADRNGVELYRLSRLYSFPDFVVNEAPERIVPPAGASPSAYADPVNRQFPCHNKAAAWLSGLFFQEKRAEYHARDAARVEERLGRFADYWQIKPECQAVKVRRAELTKNAAVALPDSSYAWVWTDAQTGHKERRLRVSNATEVKAAADWLAKHFERFPFPVRTKIANCILEKAAAFGASVGGNLDFLERQAGRGVCNPADVAAAIKDRILLAKNAELKGQLHKLAALVEGTPAVALQRGLLSDLAGALETVDRGLGIYGKYSSAMPRPEDVLFKATFTKAASEVSRLVELTSGRCYAKDQLSKLALDELTSIFGRDFAAQVSSGLDGVDGEKLAELARTLPRGDAELFDSLMSDNGISPLVLKAASVRQGFSQGDFKTLADAYLGGTITSR